MAADLKQFNQLFEQLEQEVVRLSKLETEKSQAITILEARQTHAQSAVDTATKQLEELKSLIQSYTAKEIEEKAALQAKLVDLKAQVDAKVEELHSIQLRHQELEDAQITQVAEHTGTITGLQREIDDLITSQTDLETEIAAQKTTLATAKADTQAALDAHDAQKATLDADITQQKNVLSQLKTDSSALETLVESTRREVDEASQALKAIQAEAAKVQKQQSAASNALEQLKKELEIRESSVTDRERQLEVQLFTNRRRGLIDKQT